MSSVSPPSSSTQNCFQCGKEPPQGTPFSRCGKCKAVRYCSVDCQKQSWKTHKAACPILASFKPLPASDEIVCHFYRQGQLVPLTQEQVFQETGIRFCITNFASPAFVTKNAALLIPERIEPHFTSSLYLARQGQMGVGLKTKDPIPADKIICPWLGEVRSADDTSYGTSIYGQQVRDGLCIDPSKTGSFPAFCNDGPPNCATKIGLKGQATYLTSIRPLLPDEWLFVDYGPRHPVKAGPYFLSQESEETMQVFCAEHDAYHPKTEYERLMCQYIFTTFPAFMKLHLAKVLSADTTLSQLGKNVILGAIAAESPFFEFCKTALTFISKHKERPEFLEKLSSLFDDVTVRCYFQILIRMVGADSISDQRFNELREFGKLLDQAYRWVNGTLIDTYADTPLDPHEELFALETLRPAYDALPRDLKDAFLKQLHIFVKGSLKIRKQNVQKGERQAKALMDFIATTANSDGNAPTPFADNKDDD